MKAITRIAPVFLICVLYSSEIAGQLKVDGSTVNLYTPVLEIINSSGQDRDSVRVCHPELFSSGDTAVFHITRGAEIYNAAEHPGLEVLWGKIYNRAPKQD